VTWAASLNRRGECLQGRGHEGVSIYMGRTAVELGKSWTTRPGSVRSDVDSIATVGASQSLLPGIERVKAAVPFTERLCTCRPAVFPGGLFSVSLMARPIVSFNQRDIFFSDFRGGGGEEGVEDEERDGGGAGDGAGGGGGAAAASGSGLTPAVAVAPGVKIGLGLFGDLWPPVIDEIVGAAVGTAAGGSTAKRRHHCLGCGQRGDGGWGWRGRDVGEEDGARKKSSGCDEEAADALSRGGASCREKKAEEDDGSHVPPDARRDARYGVHFLPL
jgi:hypothetical protein